MQKNKKSKERVSTKRPTRKVKKNTMPIKIVILLVVLIILALSYSFLGLSLTAVVALMLFVIIGIGSLIMGAKTKSRRKKILSILVILFLICGIAVLSVFCVFMVYVKNTAEPKYEDAKLNTMEVSRLYDKDGNQFAKLGSENREKVKYSELPEVLVDAIVATEDSRFFQHNGFDAPRFIKASIGQVLHTPGAGGASTISMQVVKNSFTDKYGEKTSGIEGITRKFEDIYLSVFKLEKEFTKEEIIEYYVNNHFLGGNIYGVEEASELYFGKKVSDVNLSEAAILAGMFKSPNAYKPTTNPENAAARRKTVLYLMRRHGYITKEEEAIANAIPVEALTANAGTTNENKYQGFIDTVVDELKAKYGVNPYTTPLLVYTTLDRSRQDAVNSVLNGESYNWKDDRVQAGVAVVESETGKILAIGNGRNVTSRTSDRADQFNFATEIRRQPGSTAKPLFDYGPGIEFNNWSTYKIFDDAPYSYSNGKSLSNWDNSYFGRITLRSALSASRNIPALKAFQQVDNAKIRDFVANLGIEPEVCSYGYIYNVNNKKCENENDASDTAEPTNVHEAHAIGAFTGTSPLEMAGAYSAFSNGGYYTKPYSVTKIVYRQSKKEEVFTPDRKQVMQDSTAYMISSVLQEVSLSGGNPANVARKTGTTNYDDKTMADNNMPGDAVRDSWVVGYSTKTAIGLWYGYDTLTKDLIAQGYIQHMIPATIQKDMIFNALINAGAMESNREAFQQPSSVVRVSVAAGSDPPKLAAPGQEAVSELFKKGYEPTEYDTSNYKVGAPANFKATEDKGKVTLSWSAVDPGILANAAHGKWGYNIYKDGKLIDWTTKTSYTYTPTNPYGTYKVIATYKSYTDAQSYEATTTLEKPAPEKPDPEEPTISCPADATLNTATNKCECNDETKIYDEILKVCK